MPIYEFTCRDCGRLTSAFTKSMSAEVKTACSHCGSPKLRRLISRVAAGRSSGSSLDGLDERMLSGVDESDPRSMARFARRMRDELGEDAGPEFDQAIEQMEAGQFPDEDGGDWPDED